MNQAEHTENKTAARANEHHEHHDPVANKMGMWLFLFTEVILFGMLFLSFAVYLYKYRWEFRSGSAHLEIILGAINTVILLTSSLTVVLAIAALQKDNRSQCIRYLAMTIFLSLGFMLIKAIEWSGKIADGIYPNGPHLEELEPGEKIFFGLYFVMTGMHAFHVILGAVVIAAAAVLVHKGKIHRERIGFLENTGLFWHLVDMVWIFLFPLFYLIG